MSHYLHGSEPAEQSRLSRLNDLINERCFSKLALAPGMQVLDVASGLGQLSFKMCHAVGTTGRCLGIERDSNQLAAASAHFSAPQLEFRQGDALNLPLNSNEIHTFDFVHMRFLLEHLSHPAKAVAETKRALKPGGKIFLADDDHATLVLYPEPEGFAELWAAYCESYVEVGNDPFIGRKLHKLLLEQGFSEVKTDVVFFGDCQGTDTFELYVSNLVEVIATSKDVMLQANLISPSAYAKGIQNILEWGRHPHAALWYTIAVATGVKLH